MSLKIEKELLRGEMKLKKQSFTNEELKARSQTVLSKLEQTSLFKQASVVLFYWSLPDEVFTHDFIEKWSSYKKILLPVVNGDMLEIREYLGKKNMQMGKFNILCPQSEIYEGQIDLAVIPGVAFDKQGNRLGRGKGFYDKFLTSFRGIKIGLCFDFQLLDKVPSESFDQKVDTVISSNRI